MRSEQILSYSVNSSAVPDLQLKYLHLVETYVYKNLFMLTQAVHMLLLFLLFDKPQ